jgi:hypothetical protein
MTLTCIDQIGGRPMDLVLGLSMTPATVRMVLVEGASGEGATIDHDEFAAGRPVEHVVAAVTGTDAIAAAGDHRLRSIGVTWTDGAEADVAFVLESLADAGIHNVVAVPAPEAAQVLAGGIAGVAGFEAVGVCFVEPDVVMVVKTVDGAVIDVRDRSVNPGDTSAASRWLVAALHTSDWQPERVVIVGSAQELAIIAAELDAAVRVPVVSATEAELALARGAALASARARHVGADTWLLGDGVSPPGASDVGKVRVPTKMRALTTVFVAAVITFVVSLAVAVGLRLTPDRESKTASPQQMANASAEPQLVQRAAQPPAAAALPPAPPPAAPPPAPAAAPVEAPPPEAAPSSEPQADAPVAAQLEVPAAAPPVEPPAAAPAVDPPVAPPPAYVPPPTDPPVLQPKHPFLSRIPGIRRLPGVSDPVVPPQTDPGVPVPPPAPDPPQ